MPVHNESSGIQEFLNEISEQFKNFEISICVVDDFSKDSTASKVQELALTLPIVCIRNERNIGHGPSTINALRLALSTGCDFVLAVDGDGQFHANEMRMLVERCLVGESDLGLGIRIRQEEPMYRRFTSWVTRILVSIKTKRRIIDANTPLRFYRREVLNALLCDLDKDNPIPNLFISVRSIEMNLKTVTLPVAFRDRRGGNNQSTSWGKSLWNFPSKRFVVFCAKSISYWFKSPNSRH
jgi:glycosyltransferase involved in cell wall biosynthesis